MAIDWLWDVIPASERDGYITALVIKGLEPMWSAFLTRPTWSWWAFNPINWNCVCSGGTMLGALLLADYPGAPDYVTNGSLLAYASDSFRVCASDYSSDNGSYWEGSMYFGYQSLYYVLAAAALESCGAGGANGLDAIPGGNETARWEQQSQGVANALVSTGTKIVEGKAVATGGQSQAKYFNWADAEEGGVNLAHAFWFARRYQDSATTAWLQAQYDPDLVPGVDVSQLAWMQTALLMVFYPGLPPVSPGDRSALPLSAMYPGNALAYSRSSWSDPQASFWAAKGGNTTYNHGDLDIGTYVLDLQGARFVSDLGADSYSLPDCESRLRWCGPMLFAAGCCRLSPLTQPAALPSLPASAADFGKARWQYYRKNTHGHNVPMFDGRNQTFAPYHNPISAWYAPGDGNAIAVIDSTQVYEGLASLNRTFVFMPSDGTRAPQLTVNDRFVYKPGFAPGNLTIAVHTYGNVTLGPEPLSATVTVDGVTARYYLADPKPCAGATLTATAVRLAPPQTPTDGLTRLDVVVPSPAASGCTMVTTAWQVMA